MVSHPDALVREDGRKPLSQCLHYVTFCKREIFSHSGSAWRQASSRLALPCAND
jgi:hypothetical protein